MIPFQQKKLPAPLFDAESFFIVFSVSFTELFNVLCRGFDALFGVRAGLLPMFYRSANI
ncbi:hypothetical protein BACIH_3091 [Bacillus amyloliquefaciens]|nr:hypothetical protein U471_31120 [Bacillus amyloliquefaciens CC178]QEY90476.1 hypothetical protein BACIT_2599 [Bacillus amyloliquefaciens]QEY94788.1 hypothetical protein BACIH_3091 [Bacillus amyloliquefaciens]